MIWVCYIFCTLRASIIILCLALSSVSSFQFFGRACDELNRRSCVTGILGHGCSLTTMDSGTFHDAKRG
ncbi:hypothetical protein K469DRAFT_717111 [Zopfia rhizophila CBS 207.26]|uniref:Uncharacterized protein n=1 Tax=Zopfia rhizophila CBS 207.26 TaxID=1314779 RepID=A0A6A6EMR7_9PEZI|nr:hypothetical protein K469DRAFT_717111 [Zopfia rhizophila CBS 207.26]